MAFEKMYYVVSRRLGEAMMSGRSQGVKGTIYGIYASREKAEKALEAKQAWVPTGRNRNTGKMDTMRTNPAIIVEQ